MKAPLPIPYAELYVKVSKKTSKKRIESLAAFSRICFRRTLFQRKPQKRGLKDLLVRGEDYSVVSLVSKKTSKKRIEREKEKRRKCYFFR